MYRFTAHQCPCLAGGAAIVALLVASIARAAGDIVLADFEGASYGAWVTTGTAFGPGPVHGALPNQMPVSGFHGQGFANSYHGGDGSTGTLTSPPFMIERKYVSFLIGGGGFEGKTCMNLLVDGKAVRTATGPNTQPGGSEELAPAAWDVGECAGQAARIEIVDRATGGWGHINVDQIVLTDQKPAVVGRRDADRVVVLEKRYLNLPVRTGAPKRRMSVSVDGQIVREFDIELADHDLQFWTILDVSAWKGKSATLHVRQLPDDSTALALIEQGDAIKDAADLYHEPLRPQFHFSARRGWLNDPNGLVFDAGEWHLFFQHNPYGWDWGNMHWGHAVSRDLVHWTELPIAIYPKQYGDWAFSGSAVIDHGNTAGFKSGDADPLVAAYTSTGRGECIVYSNDRGRTWTEFAGNAVVRHRGRDPRLLWHGPTHRWVMAVYDEGETGKARDIAFYNSPDLKAWTFRSRIAGFYECPDLFELPLDGDASNRKWVLTAASSEYRIGQFDGERFAPDTPMLPGSRGNALYAAQTYSDAPGGRRVQIGWGRSPTPGMAFNQMMCFPCELSLRTTPDGPRLCWQPVKEIETLYAKDHEWKDVALDPLREFLLTDVEDNALDIAAEIEPGIAGEVRILLRGATVRYDARAQELICGDRRAPLRPAADGRVRLRLLVDRTSVEIFADGGATYMPMIVVPMPQELRGAISIDGDGGTTLRRLAVHELKSAWPSTPPRPAR